MHCIDREKHDPLTSPSEPHDPQADPYNDALLEILTNACHGDYASLSDVERDEILAMVSCLLDDCSAALRREFVTRLSIDDQAPRELIVYLAHCEIDIAEPLLRDSPILDDETLIEIVRQKSVEHRLAIAGRREIGPKLADTLVSLGTQDIVMRLIRNPGASFAIDTIERMAEASRQERLYQYPLICRDDIPAHLLVRLYGFVSDALRDLIRERFPSFSERNEVLLEDVSTASRSALRETDERRKPGGSAPELYFSVDEPSPNHAIGALRAGHLDPFLETISNLSGLDLELTRTAFVKGPLEAVAIICKAAGLRTNQFLEVFGVIAQAVHRIAQADLFLLKSEASEAYQSLDPGVARRTTNAWNQKHQARNSASIDEIRHQGE